MSIADKYFKEEVEDILMASNTLLDMVNGILDISKIETNKIEIINGESDQSSLDVEGDAKFIEYFLVEKADGKLCVNVKNPTGSDTHWFPYDRGNYKKNNKIMWMRVPNPA